MSLYLARDGAYYGVEPAHPDTVYHDRPKGGAWEEVEIWTQQDNLVGLRFIAANVVLSTQPDGRPETRPAGTWGLWEQHTLSLIGVTATVERAGTVYELVGYTAPISAPHLEQRGTDFVDATGQRIVFAGIDGFLDYRMWLDQGAAGLDPFMQESNDLGFTVRRVFLQGSKSQNQVLELVPANEPRWRSELRPFVAYENSKGIIPLLTFCIDNQIVKSDVPALWNAAHAELAELAYLASFGNELDKNGGNPNDCPTPPTGVCWSRGSKTQDDFYRPNGATAAEFHPVRNLEDGRTQMDAVASVFYMRKNGCGMLWLDESFPFDNETPAHYGYELGRLYATYWSVAVMHNRQSQRGLLMGPGTRACAEQWVKGMTL